MKVTRLAVLTALCCSVLSACGGDVNPTIARNGAPVLDRVLPGDFERFSIGEGGFGWRRERCGATIVNAHRGAWFTGPHGDLALEGPRPDYDVVSLTAEKTEGHWQITESDADPHSIDMNEFETRVTECVNAFHAARTRWAEQDRQDRARSEQNMKSWEAGKPQPASGA